MFVGSEGTLGVITKAKMRISKLPKDYIWSVALYKTFEEGTNAIKDMVQAGIHASITRLSDATETKVLSLMSNSIKSTFKKQFEKLMKSHLNKKGYGNPCILMMRFAIKNETDRYMPVIAKAICKKNGATTLPANVSSTWEEKRFALPYLRDTMIEHRIMVDTFETVTYWSNIQKLYQSVHNSLVFLELRTS